MNVDEIGLRHCGIDDAEALALVGGATFLDAFAGVLDGESIVAHCHAQHNSEAYRHYFTAPDTHAWFATAGPGAAPIGYAMLTSPDLPLDDIGPDDIELKRIYVLSRFQRYGVGRLLLDRATEQACAMGRRRMLLGVFAENHKALGFYRNNGFEQIGVRTFQVGRMICEDFVLGKRLSAG